MQKDRDQSFDVLRALFVISVIVFHYTVRWSPPMNEVNLYNHDIAFGNIFNLGMHGVEAFFILSGYFISSTTSKSKSVMDFTYRRMIRLTPAFYASATITFLFITFNGPEYFKVDIYSYLMTLTYVGKELGFHYVDGAYWSLAVEVKFYFLVALGLWLFKEKYYQFMIFIGLFASALELIYPNIAKYALISEWMAFFLFGMSLNYFKAKSYGAAHSLLLSSVSLFIIYMCKNEVGSVITISVWAIIITAVSFDLFRLRSSFLSYIGVISYELYLIHQNMGVSMISKLNGYGFNSIISIIVTTIAIVAVASAVHHLVQTPISLISNNIYKKVSQRRMNA